MCDTKGRTRAAKRKAKQVVRVSVREELEYDSDVVSFKGSYVQPEREEDETIDSLITRSVVSSKSNRTEMASRVDALESDMAHVKSKVDNVDAKLDILINSAVFSAPAAASTPPRPTRRAQLNTPAGAPARSYGRYGEEERLPPPPRTCLGERTRGDIWTTC